MRGVVVVPLKVVEGWVNAGQSNQVCREMRTVTSIGFGQPWVYKLRTEREVHYMTA